MSNKNLTAKQEQFCQEYMLTSVAAEAYRAAYCPETTNTSSITRLAFDVFHNPKIQARIKELKEQVSKRNAVTIDMVVAEYAKIAFTNLPGIIDYKHGLMSIEDFDNLTDAQRACIKKFKFKTEYKIEDDEPVPINSVEFELHDKQHALDMLGKHLGMFIEKKQIESTAEVVNVNMTKEEYEAVRNKMIKDDDC